MAVDGRADLPFPVVFGVTRDMADRLGAWWEDRRGIIQPSEFILDAAHEVISSTYSSGPIGRVTPEDALRMIDTTEKRRREQSGGR